MKSRCRGFTLIELMIVVVVVAILSAIAIPSYKDYVIRARITQALRWLSTAQPRMEQCYQDNRTYNDGGSVDCCVKALADSADDFALSCTSDTATYTLTATGTGTMTGFTYTLDQADARATSAAPAGWGTGSCWIAKKGQTC
jgi:type IV pilus assembly protein PilE